MAAVPFPGVARSAGKEVGGALVLDSLREPQQHTRVIVSHAGAVRRAARQEKKNHGNKISDIPLSFSYCPSSSECVSWPHDHISIPYGATAVFQKNPPLALDKVLAPVMCFSVSFRMNFPCKQLYVKPVCRLLSLPIVAGISFNAFPFSQRWFELWDVPTTYVLNRLP